MKSKKNWILAAVLIVLVLVMACVYFVTRPETQAGAKTVSVTVVHADGSEKQFQYHTDEEYLGAVLLAEELVQGEMGPYGLTIYVVDGEKADWNVDVLKAGHHGSSTSSGYRFIYETDPEYATVSCGKDNDYGHPHKETIDLYRDAGLPMLRTDELGTILAVSDGRDITITWEKQQSVPTDLQPAEGFGKYIANKNSKTLHTPFCSSLPKEANRIYYDSFEDAMADGCKACSGCIG